jgi:hypothetical protein
MALVMGLAGIAGAQTFTEYGAAAAGGVTGGAAGKNVSDGITAIFGKLDQQTASASKAGQPAQTQSKPVETRAAVPVVAVASVTPANSVSKSVSTSSSIARTRAAAAAGEVPDPPSVLKVQRARKAEPQNVALATPVPMLAMIPAPDLPPAPVATPDGLKAFAPGATREDILRLGAPTARISMFDDGHLTETYRYMAQDVTFGIVHLKDGVVSSIELH